MHRDRLLPCLLAAGFAGAAICYPGSAARAADPVPAPAPAPIAAPAQTMEAGSAEAPATADAWAFTLTPYLWMTSIGGTIRTPFPQVPSGTVKADFGSILDDLDFAIMLAGEARKGRFGISADFFYVDLSQGFDTDSRLFPSGGGDNYTFQLALQASYRVYDSTDTTFDLGAGLRAWSIDSELHLNDVRGGSVSTSNTTQWIDPIISARVHQELGHDFGLTLYGDVGGFGVGSQFTWQVLGTVDWSPAPWVALRAGWRTLAFNYDGDDGYNADVNLGGPILGATFSF